MSNEEPRLTKKNTHGGKRDGSGRKPMEDKYKKKFVCVTVNIPESLINDFSMFINVKDVSRSQMLLKAMRCYMDSIKNSNLPKENQ